LIDEMGFDAPLVRRTWHGVGKRPSFNTGKTSGEVSLAAALCCSRAKSGGLFFEHWSTPTSTTSRLPILEDLLRRFQSFGSRMGPSQMHREIHPQPTGTISSAFEFEELPSYAPMLNPLKPFSVWLKDSRLCNFAPWDAQELNHAIFREFHALADDQRLLRQLWHRSDLPMPRPLN